MRALTTLPLGDLVAGGEFSIAGGLPTNHIASWNGGGTNGPVHALTLLPDGDLVAGGDFTVAGGIAANRSARFDGSAWPAFGTGHALALDRPRRPS